MPQCQRNFPLIKLPIAVSVEVLVAFLHVGEEQMQTLEFLKVDRPIPVVVMYPARHAEEGERYTLQDTL